MRSRSFPSKNILRERIAGVQTACHSREGGNPAHKLPLLLTKVIQVFCAQFKSDNNLTVE